MSSDLPPPNCGNESRTAGNSWVVFINWTTTGRPRP